MTIPIMVLVTDIHVSQKAIYLQNHPAVINVKSVCVLVCVIKLFLMTISGSPLFIRLHQVPVYHQVLYL